MTLAGLSRTPLPARPLKAELGALEMPGTMPAGVLGRGLEARPWTGPR